MRANVVVGADGMIGRALADALRASGQPAFETTRRRETLGGHRGFLDLAADPLTWELPSSVAAAYLCAGVTSVEACARSPQESGFLNVERTVTLVRELARRNGFVAFLSTNLVFDGSRPRPREGDTPGPSAEYGRQKLAVEQELSRLGAGAGVRLTKVLGPRPPLLVQWIERLRRGEPVEPFSDKVMAPVPLPFAVEALRAVGERRLSGIFQVSGPSDVTYEDVARFLAERVGAPPELIRPRRSSDGALPRDLAPAHTTLDTTRLQLELGLRPPDVWSTIEWSLQGALT